PDLSIAAAAALTEAAARAGLGVDHRSPWHWISSCTGRPGCAKALADVQADARQAAAEFELAEFDPAAPGILVRFSGCARRCGRDPETQLDLVATGTGYLRTESDLA
ncbi:MAG: CobG, partial [Frankiales bacterium]|nr:CobG [Frankiales bacterium]